MAYAYTASGCTTRIPDILIEGSKEARIHTTWSARNIVEVLVVDELGAPVGSETIKVSLFIPALGEWEALPYWTLDATSVPLNTGADGRLTVGVPLGTIRVLSFDSEVLSDPIDCQNPGWHSVRLVVPKRR